MVRIITDSTCDLSKSRQVELGVEVAPLSVHFGAETFRDGVDLTNGDFYARLRRAEALPTTSQVNPEDFAARFRACREAGDEVVGIFISSLLSGREAHAGSNHHPALLHRPQTIGRLRPICRSLCPVARTCPIPERQVNPHGGRTSLPTASPLTGGRIFCIGQYARQQPLHPSGH